MSRSSGSGLTRGLTRQRWIRQAFPWRTTKLTAQAVDTLGLASIELVIANAGVNHSGASFKDLHIDDLDLTWRINVSPTSSQSVLPESVYGLTMGRPSAR